MDDRVRRAVPAGRTVEGDPTSLSAGGPLSFSQQALWFLEQLHPGLPTYNIPLTLRLVGELDVPALEATLSHIVARHDALRTTYGERGGAPFQRVGPPVRVTLPPTDLRGLPGDARAAAVAGLTAAEADRPFDLTRDLPLRARLLRVEDAAHVLALTLHHIAADGVSLRILLNEMVALYEAFRRGLASPLPQLELQYGDFVTSQRRRLLDEGVLERQLAYWRRQLAGLSDLDIPADRPRPARPSFAGGHVRRRLPAELLPALESLARTERATVFMLLLAAFIAVLHRYSGQDDVTVGTPAAGRNIPRFEPLVGLFINMLVLRTDLGGDPSFAELVKQVRGVVLDAVENQEVPFENLVEELRPQRDPGRHPLFQIAFTVDEAPSEPMSSAGLRLEPDQLTTSTSRFDLQLAVAYGPGRLSVAVEYSTELFDRERIERLLDHFEMALWSATKNPRQRVSRLPLLPAGERRTLLSARDQNAAPYPADRCLHELIELRARERPRSVALRCEGAELSYEDLDARADRLAAVLRSRGAGPERRVGVLLDRSIPAVVALLGILKSGGAYVPLEPSYPDRRVRQLLAATGATIVVSDRRLADRLPPEVTVVTVDGGETATARARHAAPHPDNLAYVIHTSGSTGEPKGVMISHRSVVNFVTQFGRIYGVEPGTRVLHAASLTFDHSVLELFTALTAGATACIAPDAVKRLPHRLSALLRDEAVAVAALQPALLAPMPAGPYPALRALSVGSEAFSGALVDEWNVPGRRLFNIYGPTEATGYVTAYECPHREHRDSPPVGWAAANHRMYVLDRHGNLAPMGVPGEIYIAGVGLARGYQDRPGLTAESFVPDPFAPTAGERMYRTGDIGCYLPDGAIRFLRRADAQLKIRGVRVEPAEIEAVLARHPRVRQVVVVGREDVPGDRRLVAYLAVAGDRPTVDQLRSWVAAELPEYLVPSAFVLLDALPRNKNGKVDRRALPAPSGDRGDIGQAYVPPRTRTEKVLAETVFADVLKVRQVGARDGFFDLGGNSLQVPRLVARVGEEFGVDIDVGAVYSLQSVARIAELIDRGLGAGQVSEGARRTGPGLVVMRPDGSRAPFFCVHPRGGSVFCYADLADRLAADRPFLGLESVGLGGEDEPLQRIEEMAERYLDHVLERQAAGPYHLGGWSLGGLVAFEMAHRLRARGHAVALVAMVETHLPDGRRPEDDELVTLFADDLAGVLGGQAPALDPPPTAASPERRAAHVAARLDAAGLLPPGVDQAQLQNRFRVFLANVRAFESYRPRPYPGRINLVQAERSGDLAARWRPHAAGGVVAATVPGDHFGVVRPPTVDLLAGTLRGWLSGE